MAYLPQFKQDVFISYRRASNEGDDQWVDQFCKTLQAQLHDLVSGDVQLWRDTAELRSGDKWRPEIADAVLNSGVFVALASRTYFDSPECVKEFDLFLGRLKNADGGDGRKLVPIFKHPPKPDQDLPVELNTIGRHELFQLDPKPWRALDPVDDAHEYKRRLGRIAGELMVTLEELKSREKKKARGKVFLAAVGDELSAAREDVRADLRSQGFLVLPEREYLWNADDHRERIERDLAESLVCVHLVSRLAGTDPLTAARSRLQLQLAQAAMSARQRPPPLVWIQPADATDPSTQSLIDYIESDLANAGVEVLAGGLEELKSQVFDLLPKPVRAAPPKPREVALLIEEADIAAAAPLRELLAEKLNLDAKLVKFSGATPKDAARMAKTLATATQCLVFWSQQPEEWVDDLLDLGELADHLGRERMAVFVAGPPSSEKAAYRTPNARLVQGVVSAGEAELRGFFDTADGR